MDTVTRDTDLRARALERLKKKREFWLHFTIFAMANVSLVLVWAIYAPAFFWPVFPLVGWGIGVVAHAFDVYGRAPSEDRIQREIKQLH